MTESEIEPGVCDCQAGLPSSVSAASYDICQVLTEVRILAKSLLAASSPGWALAWGPCSWLEHCSNWRTFRALMSSLPVTSIVGSNLPSQTPLDVAVGLDQSPLCHGALWGGGGGSLAAGLGLPEAWPAPSHKHPPLSYSQPFYIWFISFTCLSLPAIWVFPII